VSTLGPQTGEIGVFAPQIFRGHVWTPIGHDQFQSITRLVAKFRENRIRNVENYVSGNKKKQVVEVIWHKTASPPLHSAHPSLETKRHLDQSSRFCTRHGRMSSVMPGHVPFAKNCSSAWTDLDRHLTHSSFSTPEPTTQTASWSVQPVLHSSHQSVVGHNRVRSFP